LYDLNPDKEYDCDQTNIEKASIIA